MQHVADNVVGQQQRQSGAVTGSVGALATGNFITPVLTVPDREMWVVTFAGAIGFTDDVDLTASGGVCIITSDLGQGLGTIALGIPVPIQVFNDVIGQAQYMSVFLNGLVLFSADIIQMRVAYTNVDAINAANVTSLTLRIRYTPLLRVSEQAVSLLQNQQIDANLAARLRAQR